MRSFVRVTSVGNGRNGSAVALKEERRAPGRTERHDGRDDEYHEEEGEQTGVRGDRARHRPETVHLPRLVEVETARSARESRGYRSRETHIDVVD